MNLIYNETDLDTAHRRYSTWRGLMILFTVCVLALLGVCIAFRLEWIGYAVVVLAAASWVFSAGMVGGPRRRYYKFMKDMATGRTRVFSGIVTSVDEDMSEQGGVRFVRLYLHEDGTPDEEPDKILYYDAFKLPLPMKKGDTIEVELFGNTMKAWKAGNGDSIG